MYCSLLNPLRAQVHMEIARCAAQVEKLPEAIAQLERALQLDSGANAIGPGAGEQRERIEHLLHRLRLRADLYQQPDRPEDRAAMILEQVSCLLCFSPLSIPLAA